MLLMSLKYRMIVAVWSLFTFLVGSRQNTSILLSISLACTFSSGTGRDSVSFCFAPSVLSFSGVCGERASEFLFGLRGFKGCRTILAFAVGGVSPCDGILGLFLSHSTYRLARSESKSGGVLFSPSRFYLCVFGLPEPKSGGVLLFPAGL
jgi:hypothetical protein